MGPVDINTHVPTFLNFEKKKEKAWRALTIAGPATRPVLLPPTGPPAPSRPVPQDR